MTSFSGFPNLKKSDSQGVVSKDGSAMKRYGLWVDQFALTGGVADGALDDR
jgi:hypothetical protein